MKYCVVSTNNLSMVPYFAMYKNLLRNFDLIYWDRNNDSIVHTEGKIYKFKSQNSKHQISYFKFLMFVKKILNKNEYDKVIFLHSQVGICIYPFIKNKYKGKYICDIRDYEYENYWIYRKLEKKFIENSLINIISSPGYKTFLPEGEYYVLHNDRKVDEKYIDKLKRKETKDKIVIGNIGFIRFQEQNKKLIDKLKNDDRFEMRFLGTGAENLKEFCQKNDVKNVILKDYFKSEKTMDYFSECDVIFNLYGNHTPHLDYALSNKLYIAARFSKPILVCPETFMEKISTEYGFGIVVDLNEDNVADLIWNKYHELIASDMNENCLNFIKKIEKENKETKDILKKSLLSD